MPDAPRQHNARPRAKTGFTREAKRALDRQRPTASQRGYDARWRRLRAWVLQRDLYLCQRCHASVGDGEMAHVDHIEPFHGKDDPRRLDETNLQTLCRSCHSRKTLGEDVAGRRGKECDG
jgi:5-methylcytosine-specific restriction protein A